MKWRAETGTLGNFRCRRVFAWIPTRVGEWTVWLEFFQVEERFIQPVNGKPGTWDEISRTHLEPYI